MRTRMAIDGLIIALAGLVPTVDAFFALSTGPISGNECTVSYSADESTKGYQFEMFLAPNAPLAIDGGQPLTSFFPDFFVSGIPSTDARLSQRGPQAHYAVRAPAMLGTRLPAFPFSDGTIPPTNGQVLPLVTIPLLGASDGVFPCLDNVVVGADPTGSHPAPLYREREGASAAAQLQEMLIVARRRLAATASDAEAPSFASEASAPICELPECFDSPTYSGALGTCSEPVGPGPCTLPEGPVECPVGTSPLSVAGCILPSALDLWLSSRLTN
eukprot:scaffold2390_cov280-Prasinococcus_capsulatus_cf.AAC.3